MYSSKMPQNVKIAMICRVVADQNCKIKAGNVIKYVKKEYNQKINLKHIKNSIDKDWIEQKNLNDELNEDTILCVSKKYPLLSQQNNENIHTLIRTC